MTTDSSMEVLQGLKHHTPECDWWGCGTRTFEGYAFCEAHRKSQTVKAGSGRGSE